MRYGCLYALLYFLCYLYSTRPILCCFCVLAAMGLLCFSNHIIALRIVLCLVVVCMLLGVYFLCGKVDFGVYLRFMKCSTTPLRFIFVLHGALWFTYTSNLAWIHVGFSAPLRFALVKFYCGMLRFTLKYEFGLRFRSTTNLAWSLRLVLCCLLMLAEILCCCLIPGCFYLGTSIWSLRFYIQRTLGFVWRSHGIWLGIAFHILVGFVFYCSWSLAAFCWHTNTKSKML